MTAFENLAALKEIEPEWRALAEGRGNAFLTPEWLISWFDHYGDEATPFVPVLKGGDGKLRGLLALALARSGRPRVCRLGGGSLGDRFHPLCEPMEEHEVAAAAGEALAAAGRPWSILALDHVEAQQPWISGLAEGTGVRLRRRERSAAELPLIDLSRHTGWEDYLATRSKNLRQQIRRFAKRAGQRHSMELRRTRSCETLRHDLSVLWDLHDRRWGERSSLRSNRARAFLADFSAAALKRGWLRLWFLEMDEQPVAAWYGWRVGDRYSYYNGGFDPAWSASSPGLVLMSKVIESAFEEGAAQFEFLLGDERYKLRFAERSRSVSDVMLSRALPHPAAAVASAEDAARRLGRLIPVAVRHRLRLTRRSMLWGRER